VLKKCYSLVVNAFEKCRRYQNDENFNELDARTIRERAIMAQLLEAFHPDISDEVVRSSTPRKFGYAGPEVPLATVLNSGFHTACCAEQ